MHTSAETQTTATLQRAGEERRCTEMKRSCNAAKSGGALDTSKMHYRGDAEGQREEEEEKMQRLHVKLASGGFWALFGFQVSQFPRDYRFDE